MNFRNVPLARRLKIATLTGFVTLTLVSPALAAPNDAWITTKTKLTLMTTEGVGSMDVNVDTVNRQVTLHGTVNTVAERDKAEIATKSIDGVSNVRNLLQVVAPSREAAVAKSDDAVSAEVTAALQGNKSLANSSIVVQSVNKGVVLLKGDARNLTDALSAVETAASVAGVRRVASEIQSPELLADSKMWREAEANAHSAPPAGAPATTSEAVADLYTTTMVKMRLLSDQATPAMEINVDTRNSNVVLFGIVPTAAAKAAAGADARAVAGVRDVKNELQVVSAAQQPAVDANDTDIATGVRKNVAEHASLKDVTIEVKNCVARLSGTVPSGDERIEAMQVARASRGVCSVQNDLTFLD